MESLGPHWAAWCIRPGREPEFAEFDWNLRPQGLQAVGAIRAEMFQASGFREPAGAGVRELESRGRGLLARSEPAAWESWDMPGTLAYGSHLWPLVGASAEVGQGDGVGQRGGRGSRCPWEPGVTGAAWVHKGHLGLLELTGTWGSWRPVFVGTCQEPLDAEAG